MNLKSDDASDLNYSASLKEGTLYVYYDSDDDKKEVFSINGGETISDTLDVNANKGCFIIEANSTCANCQLYTFVGIVKPIKF